MLTFANYLETQSTAEAGGIVLQVLDHKPKYIILYYIKYCCFFYLMGLKLQLTIIFTTILIFD